MMNLCGQTQTLLILSSEIYKFWQRKNLLNIAPFAQLQSRKTSISIWPLWDVVFQIKGWQ